MSRASIPPAAFSTIEKPREIRRRRRSPAGFILLQLPPLLYLLEGRLVYDRLVYPLIFLALMLYYPDIELIFEHPLKRYMIISAVGVAVSLIVKGFLYLFD